MTQSHINSRTLRRWIVVGYGRVGQTLPLVAERVGASVHATWNRTEASADAAHVPSPDPRWGSLPTSLEEQLQEPCVLWLTVVDEAIEPVFALLQDHIAPGSIVIHTSGSIASTVLAGHPSASLHPLQAISAPHAAVERFHRTFWTIEGDDTAVDTLTALLEPAGISPTRIDPEKKPLYHASAVTAANLMVSLMDAAIAIAEAAEIDTDAARHMLVELASSSLDNLSAHPPAQALTGPAARGDLDVIDTHRRALRSLEDDSLLQIYDLLTQRILAHLTTHTP